MSQMHSYAVERQTSVTIPHYGSDTLMERPTSAWVLVDTFESDKSSFAAMDGWFATAVEADLAPEAGRYRLVEFTSYGGNFIEFEVKQKLILEEVRRLAEVA